MVTERDADRMSDAYEKSEALADSHESDGDSEAANQQQVEMNNTAAEAWHETTGEDMGEDR